MLSITLLPATVGGGVVNKLDNSNASASASAVKKFRGYKSQKDERLATLERYLSFP
jgi:hypothetical protein